MADGSSKARKNAIAVVATTNLAPAVGTARPSNGGAAIPNMYAVAVLGKGDANGLIIPAATEVAPFEGSLGPAFLTPPIPILTSGNGAYTALAELKALVATKPRVTKTLLEISAT